jgi:hypothetical protein
MMTSKNLLFLTLALATGALTGCKTCESCCAGGDWIVLFDGSSTEAFRGYKTDAFPPGWAVEGDVLHVLPTKGADLMTREKFEDFELTFEWKTSPRGNSGVIYKVVETKGPAWHTGFEYQILDDAAYFDGNNTVNSTASLYDLLAPSADKKLKPAGQWNSGKIVVQGARCEHWLNGRKVLQFEQGSPELQALIAKSKFGKIKDPEVPFGSVKAGHICFQAHGQEVWFRNIKIRKL